MKSKLAREYERKGDDFAKKGLLSAAVSEYSNALYHEQDALTGPLNRFRRALIGKEIRDEEDRAYRQLQKKYKETQKRYWDSPEAKRAGKISASMRIREPEKEALEKRVTIPVIVLLIASLFFLSTNITGNAIGSLPSSSSNILGIVLIIVAIFLFVFGIKRKNKKL